MPKQAGPADPVDAPGAADTVSGVTLDARPFPRQFTAGATPFNIHQPQYDSW